MATPKFTIITKRGKVVTGVVHGSGGAITTLARLQGGVNRATRGLDSGFYEPKPGHVAVFPSENYNTVKSKRSVVDIRGATVLGPVA